jgi:hypothetical protein
MPVPHTINIELQKLRQQKALSLLTCAHQFIFIFSNLKAPWQLRKLIKFHLSVSICAVEQESFLVQRDMNLTPRPAALFNCKISTNSKRH